MLSISNCENLTDLIWVELILIAPSFIFENILKYILRLNIEMIFQKAYDSLAIYFDKSNQIRWT